jgi:hypothetical protein
MSKDETGHGCSLCVTLLLVGCSEATGGGLWPRLVLIHVYVYVCI